MINLSTSSPVGMAKPAKKAPPKKAAAATDSGVEKKKRGRPLGSKNSKPAQKKPGAKPRGRPPKGCTWSDEKQAYIDDSTGEEKKK